MTPRSRHILRLLLTPSWVSGFIGICAACVWIGFVLIEGQYQGSELYGLVHEYRPLSNTNELFNTFTLFIFWYAVGTVLYVVLSAAYRTVRSAQVAQREVRYANMSRSAYLRGLYGRVVLRLISLGVWVGYALLTLHSLAPELTAIIREADQHLPAAGAWLLLVVSAVGVFVVVHMHVVLLRLLCGRPRLLGSDAEMIGLSSSH
jgi:hypothetical protein